MLNVKRRRLLVWVVFFQLSSFCALISYLAHVETITLLTRPPVPWCMTGAVSYYSRCCCLSCWNKGPYLSFSLCFSGGQQGDPGGPAEVRPHTHLSARQLPDPQRWVGVLPPGGKSGLNEELQPAGSHRVLLRPPGPADALRQRQLRAAVRPAVRPSGAAADPAGAVQHALLHRIVGANVGIILAASLHIQLEGPHLHHQREDSPQLAEGPGAVLHRGEGLGRLQRHPQAALRQDVRLPRDPRGARDMQAKRGAGDMRGRAWASGQLVQPAYCQAGQAEGVRAGPGNSCGALLHGSNHGQRGLQLRGLEKGQPRPHRPAEADGLFRRAYAYAAHRQRQAVPAAVGAEAGQQLCGDDAVQTHPAARDPLYFSGSVHAVLGADIHPQVSLPQVDPRPTNHKPTQEEHRQWKRKHCWSERDKRRYDNTRQHSQCPHLSLHISLRAVA